MKKIKYLLYKYKILNIIILNGIRLNIKNLHYHKNELLKLISGKYEIGENEIMKETLSKDDTLLELGTGLGYNSIFAKKFLCKNVYTFEGNPELLPIIKENTRLNNVSINVSNKIVVVGEHKETMSFNVAQHYTGSSIGELDSQTTLKNTYKIETVTINELITQYAPTYFMCDIEGGEINIFNDCRFLKDSTINKILIELHPRVLGEKKTLELINNIVNEGYELRFDKYPKKYCFFTRTNTN